MGLLFTSEQRITLSKSEKQPKLSFKYRRLMVNLERRRATKEVEERMTATIRSAQTTETSK